MATAITNDLRVRLQDRLRHAEQYAEAARLMVEDARRLLEEEIGEREEDGDDA
jgi:hypothetical protein